MKANNLVGGVFNRLTVVSDGGRDRRQNIMWNCVCICGGTALAFAYDLRSGKVKSCGCLNREGRNRTHGMAGPGKKRNRTYSIWAAMLQRCKNPNDPAWQHYGGRGITVCSSWYAFETFFADMGEKPEGLSLDRVDNSLGYCKENCRWATATEQGRNKRSNRWITVGNKTQIMADWCREVGTTNAEIINLVKKGMTYAEAIERISRKKRCEAAA